MGVTREQVAVGLVLFGGRREGVKESGTINDLSTFCGHRQSRE